MKRQFLVLLSSRLLAAAIQAIVGVVLARTTGPGNYGEISAFAGVTFFVFVVCGLGIPNYLSRARALKQHDVVASALFINATGSFVGVAIVVIPLLAGMYTLTSGTILALLVIGTAFEKNADAALAVLIADGDQFNPAANVLLRRLITAASFFGLLKLGQDPVNAYCLASAFGPALGQAHVHVLLNRRGVDRANRASSTQILRRALPFAINDVAVQSRSLVVMIVAAVTTPVAAGLYSGAAKMIAPSELAASTLGGVILPRAAVMTARQQRSTALKLTALAGMIFPCAALLAAVSEPVVVFLLGEEYRAAATSFAVLSLTLPLLVLSSPMAALLQGMHHERLLSRGSIAFAVGLLVAVLVGAVLGGATGAAFGVLAATGLKALWLVTAVVMLSRRGR
ncbi:lipopolysaccharide biosynthesis protein [Mycolicibacterium hodleri]|uniref:lipopolysaccharide biosynthesis protein n=1 Tax=Mycolicibacterium hodleri TaxID=49897 RepID=UPI00163B6A2F|nr:lipopolysaccharide biosynthesis protein [Mycolicibacterium hodleri]